MRPAKFSEFTVRFAIAAGPILCLLGVAAAAFALREHFWQYITDSPLSPDLPVAARWAWIIFGVLGNVFMLVVEPYVLERAPAEVRNGLRRWPFGAFLPLKEKKGQKVIKPTGP